MSEQSERPRSILQQSPRKLKRCNICGLLEPYTKGQQKTQPDECGGHQGIHPFLWNLNTKRERGSRNYDDYQKFLVRKRRQCGQEVTEEVIDDTK